MRVYLLLALASLLCGCVSHSTGETEVCVLVCKLGVGCSDGKGVQRVLYPPGSTNFFAPFIRDFYTFDTKVQNLEMVANASAEPLQINICSGSAATPRARSRYLARARRSSMLPSSVS